VQAYAEGINTVTKSTSTYMRKKWNPEHMLAEFAATQNKECVVLKQHCVFNTFTNVSD
jgi:hypothetical protein